MISTEPFQALAGAAALNAVCPYYTMFPIRYPLSLLRPFGSSRVRVLDPFCGRGTTVFAARLLGHEGFGIDASPVAVAIAKAKIARCTSQAVLDLADELLEKPQRIRAPRGEFWEWAYADETLRDICRLRAGLLRARSDSANLLRAVCLGALHGPVAKDPGKSGYFSNQMPRTFASKPAYSVKFWKKNDLRPRKIDVREVIARRVARLQLQTVPQSRGKPDIRHGDSTTAYPYRRIPRKIDVVISSPPYYGMRTYIADQWLRNWFIGGQPTVPYVDHKQLSHRSPDKFAISLAGVWNRVGDVLNKNGRMHIRFGAIPSRRRDACDIMLMSLGCSRHDWTVRSIRGADTADSGKRQAGQMGKRISSAAVEEFDFEIVRGR